MLNMVKTKSWRYSAIQNFRSGKWWAGPEFLALGHSVPLCSQVQDFLGVQLVQNVLFSCLLNQERGEGGGGNNWLKGPGFAMGAKCPIFLMNKDICAKAGKQDSLHQLNP